VLPGFMLSAGEIIIEEVEFFQYQERMLSAYGPTFRIVVSEKRSASTCRVQVIGVYLLHQGREYAILLSSALANLFHYFACHRDHGQTADQIAFAIRNSRSYVRYHGRPWRLARTSIKEYVARLRISLATVFTEAGLNLAPDAVLISEATPSNSVAYRLHASVEITHVNNVNE